MNENKYPCYIALCGMLSCVWSPAQAMPAIAAPEYLGDVTGHLPACWSLAGHFTSATSSPEPHGKPVQLLELNKTLACERFHVGRRLECRSCDRRHDPLEQERKGSPGEIMNLLSSSCRDSTVVSARLRDAATAFVPQCDTEYALHQGPGHERNVLSVSDHAAL